MDRLYGKLSSVGKLTGVITLSGNRLKGLLTVPSEGFGPPVPEYDGPYVVTPTVSTQTLYTDGYQLSANVIVNPIPNNYGLITWNGSTLFVS